MRQPQRVVVMRGGSSRALVFRGEDLPTEIAAQDRIFLAALGCPDPTGRQVDGLGGGASSNNKVAIVGPSKAPGIDVDYTFGQLAPDRALVDRAGNCGNISAAIGPFAIEEGIVAGTDPLTKVTIRNTNTDSTLVAHVPTPAGRFVPDGDFEIAGVPGSGSRIMLDFVEPDRSGAALPLPTGRPSDRLATARAQSFKCSLVDVSKPCVFTPFSELGLEPEVRPEQLDADGAMLALIEELRAAGSVAMGVATDTATATATIPSVPQLTFFAPGDPDCLRVLGISMGKHTGPCR
jgi:2-methylaconitate cis-trans-isomerase PrpF